MTDLITRIEAGSGGDCVTCGGTGHQWLARSWFLSDGYTRRRCGICGGTGKSAYRGDSVFAKAQALLRAHAALKAKETSDADT